MRGGKLEGGGEEEKLREGTVKGAGKGSVKRIMVRIK